MKKISLILAVLLLLTACAAQPGSVVSTEATVTEAQAETEPQTETPTEAETTEAVSETLSDLEIALSFVEKSVEELKAVIGEPIESYYEESCIGDGYDGILIYGDFTVYTFREADGSAETVVDAELND